MELTTVLKTNRMFAKINISENNYIENMVDCEVLEFKSLNRFSFSDWCSKHLGVKQEKERTIAIVLCEGKIKSVEISKLIKVEIK